jgi:hypothetical protein
VPAAAVVKPRGRKAAATATEAPAPVPATVEPSAAPLTEASPPCPQCGGRMWDNRASKRNPKAPDFKCRDRSCDGVIWPARAANGAAPAQTNGHAPEGEFVLDSSPLGSGDDIPF